MKSLAIVLLAALPALASAQQVEFGSKIKGAYDGEDARDLGQVPPPGVAPDQKRTSEYVDLNPYLHLQFNDDTAAYARVELFGSAGDQVVQQEADRPVAEQNFAALRELWLEYGGITDYPGEVLRLGLQRVREADGLWWDRDVESLRWVFDTTLTQAQLGVAEQLRTYRSDDVQLSPNERHRAYAFATLNNQWQPGYFSGIRVAYAQDHEELPAVNTTLDANSKTQERRYLWVALHTHNGFFDPRATAPVKYWFEAVGLAGRRDRARTDPTNPTDQTVIDHPSDKVTALAGDAGMRIRFPLIFPFELGGIAAYAQGDAGDADTSHTFESTGLESNRSRFTGSRTLINRFNEALQAKWSNLRSAGGLVSFPGETWDISGIWQKFQRDDGTVAFQADGITAQTVNTSRDIGRGIDLVLTKFFEFARTQVKSGSDDEDRSSNIRVRASRFDPGEAYGPDVKREYRVTLETTWWF